MQSYKKWESRKLQKKVLQTLVLASMAYVCIIGGDNSAWAASDYKGGPLDISNVADYNKMEVTASDVNGTGLYVHLRRTTLTANDRVTISLSDTGTDAYGYVGIDVENLGTFNAAKGIDITIDGRGDNNASGGDQAWRNALFVGSQGKVNLGTAEASVITINSNAADSFANGVFSDGSSAGTGYEANIKGGDLTVNINKDNADQQMDYAAGVSLFNGSKMELAGDLKIHLEANGIDGIRGNNQNNDSDINSLQVKNLEIYGKAVNGNGAGIYLMGEHDSVTSSDNTKITIQTEGNAYGIFVDGSDVASSFGKTVIDLTSKTENNDDVIGISQWGSKTDYAGLTINAQSNKADISGISLVGHDGQGIVDVKGALEIKANGNGTYVKGMDVTAFGQLNVTGKTAIDVSSNNDGAIMYGVYAQTGSTLAFKDDAQISMATHEGDSNARMYGVYSRTNANVTFEKGLTVKNSNRGEAVIAEGGTIKVNTGGGNDVKLEGYIESRAINETPGSDVLVNGTVEINCDTAQSYLNGSSYTAVGSTTDLKFTNGAYWDMKGNSSVSDLTVGEGSIINMTADSSRYSNLQVGNLNSANGAFVMNAGTVDGGGSYSDKLIIDKSSAAGVNAIKIISNGGLEDAARNNAVLVKGADSATKFAVTEPVYANGLYEFDVALADKENDGKYDWFIGSLKKNTVDSVNTMINANQVAYTAWIDGNGTLRQRLGELQNGADSGVWARMFGGKLGGDEFTNKYKTYQLGYDAQAGDWHLGAAYEYSDGSLDYTSGSGKNKIGAVSLYGTLQGKDNSALDVVIKRGRIYGDMDIYGKYSDNGDYSTDATSIGVEYTKRFDGGNNVYFEPQAQLTFGRIDGYDYVSAKGVRVAYDDINSLIGRLGIVAGKAFDKGDAYVKASVLHEFSGDSSVTMLAANGESYQADKSYGDTWLEVGIGGNIALGKNCELYGDVERSFGGDVTKNWGANIGFRYNF